MLSKGILESYPSSSKDGQAMNKPRLMPTGTCWCGCDAQVDLGSFFSPGHDKRAEARLIMEVFGGVPQFLHAFGRGPTGVAQAAQVDWTDCAMRLKAVKPNSTFVIEHAKGPNHPRPHDGHLERHPDAKLAQDVELGDGSVTFKVEGRCTSILMVPFCDIVAVYKEPSTGFWVVRVRGLIESTGGQLGGVQYASLG